MVKNKTQTADGKEKTNKSNGKGLKIKSQIKQLSPSEVELTITIPKSEVEQTYHDVLKALSKDVEVKGFRKGTAPLKLVEEKLGRTFVLRKASESLIVVSYVKAINESKLSPIADPKLIKAVTPEKGDWQLTFLVPLMPKVELPDDYIYQLAKKVADNKKIVTPNEAKLPPEEEKKKKEEDKLNKILTGLLEIAKVNLPSLIVESEVNRRLASFLDQLAKLQMSMDDYLKSRGTTSEAFRKSIEKQVEEEYRLDFILAEVGKKEKVEVKEEEIEKILAQQPQRPLDEKKRREEEAYVKSILFRNKVLELLLKKVSSEKVIIPA